jgi:hypothetical protein
MKPVQPVLAAAVVAACVLLMTVSVGAHHSIAAGFDMAGTTTVIGTITKMEWRNPHAQLTISVKNENGQMEPWSVWFSSSNGMYRRGWRKDDLPVGATVTVTGFRAKDGSNQLYGGETKLPDGRTLFGGDAPTGGQ